MNYRWRAPKKDDDKAWARIAAGDWYWEIDPKKAEWSAQDFEVHRDNPKFGKTLLFGTIAEKYKNSQLRRKQR
jgi:hypothetical protein